MRIALLVPGGVDRTGEYRVVPALLALIGRLARRHELRVFALRQEPRPGQWLLEGAAVRNIGGRATALRAACAVVGEHRRAPFDLVQAIWSGSAGLAAVLAARHLGLPSAVHVAGGELVALPQIGYGGRLRWSGRRREAWVLRHASAVSAASAPMLARLAELGVAARRLPLGVDLQRWPVQPPRPRTPGQALRLIQVASLNAVKDPATLLRAAARLADVGLDFELDLVGEDRLDGQVQALAERLGLAPRTRFHGFLTQSQLRPLLARADLHLVSSLHEAGPLVLLEAAVLGVPSVGTAVGHLSEWAPQAALTAPPGDAAALAAAIRRLADDEALRLRIAAAAQRRALAEDADHMAALFERLHAELLCGWGR